MNDLFDKSNITKTLVAAGALVGIIYGMRTRKSLFITGAAAVGLGIVGGLIGDAVTKS